MNQRPGPRRVHIIGHKNHGKTTLVCELIEVLVRRGIKVGTVKHTHHEHELDVPGKDSFRHRASGAFPAAILSRSSCAVFWDAPRSDREEERYALFEPVFADCDVVLVEGDQSASGIKIEVWRAEVGSEPLARNDPTIHLVVSDDWVDCDCRVIRRSDIARLSDTIIGWIA